MVGLSDIPCAGEIVDRVSKAITDTLFLGLKYMFCYKDYVNKLNLEMEKLTNQEERVCRKATAEEACGKKLYGNVIQWQADVEEFRRSATEFSEKYRNRASWRCIHFLPIPQPVNRFQLGREAAQKFKRVGELYDLGKDLLAFDIAYLPPVENVPKTDTVFQNFESRKAAYARLWEELVSEGSCSILGIYGMPGVGKTRMMEQLWKEALEKKIFHKVARADVGGDSLDVIKLQNQIAGGIDCRFESQDDSDRRAFQLKNSIMNNGKVLVILDDVWTEISLDVIGIPSVDDSSCKGLKILLTSRKKDACLRNNCKHPVQITVLTYDEAWALFSNTVGESMPAISLAHKVCEKCAGLPLLIRAVGKALRGTSRYSWEDALEQLEKGTVEKIPDIEPQVYSCVKFSIDRLPADAKSCLFLCSLYREDAEINIRKLIQIATGLHLVDGGKSRVCTMLDILSSSSLLLDSQVHNVIKLHDLIRDVARSVAINDQIYAFSFVRGGSRLRDISDYSTRKFLDLHLENNDFHVSGGMGWPDLQRLWLHCNNHKVQLSVGFSSMFVNLIYLLIECMSSSSGLHFSLHSLVNLRTLILDDCEMTHLNQTNVGFFPENLTNLCFWDCHLPVPLVLPNLEHLRKLEIKGWNSRVLMLPNTISILRNLEELHIPEGFEIQDEGSEPSLDEAPILTEISNLIGLRSLQMSFKRSEPFQDTNIFDKLDEYDIVVPIDTPWNYLLNPSVSTKKCIYLEGTQLEGLESLIEKAEQVKLVNSDIDVSSIWNSNRKAFSDLRELHIETCNTMGYLAKIPQDEIYNSCQPLTSFSALTILDIANCSTIKYLFSKSVAKGLGQLQSLCVGTCPVMEAIITNEDTDNGDIITFSKLCSLQVDYLPILKSFYVEKEDNYASSTSAMDNSAIPGVRSQHLIFNGMVAFPSLEEFHVRGMEDTDIWGEYYYTDSSSFCKLKTLGVYNCNKLETVFPPAMLNKMRNLETIYIWDCNSLKYVFPPSIARDLIHLKSMSVERCPMVREIIGAGEEKEITEGVVFPELTDLDLYGLTNLTSFWCYETGKENNYKAEFPNLVKLFLGSEELSIPDNFPCQRLEVLHVSNCGYSTALPLSIFRSLQQLQVLEICDSALLEEIVEDDRGDEASDMDVKTITLPQLKYFALRNLPNIKSFIRVANCDFHMPVLTEVTVDNCGISTLFTFSALRSLPQLQQLEISNCSLLEEIVEAVRGDEASVMDKKTITLSQLRSVTLTNLPNLKSFIRCANCEFHMPALSNVDISNCGLSTLFTCSVSRKLHQLADLNISNCTSLESIVDDIEDDEISLTDDKIITFSQLTSLHLSRLPNLKCFSNTSSYDFSMPKLVTFTKYSCPQIEYFTLSKTSAPRVQVETKEGQWEHIPDLNDYIRQTGKQEVASSDSDESRHYDQELETESEGVEEVQPQDSKEND